MSLFCSPALVRDPPNVKISPLKTDVLTRASGPRLLVAGAGHAQTPMCAPPPAAARVCVERRGTAVLQSLASSSSSAAAADEQVRSAALLRGGTRTRPPSPPRAPASKRRSMSIDSIHFHGLRAPALVGDDADHPDGRRRDPDEITDDPSRDVGELAFAPGDAAAGYEDAAGEPESGPRDELRSELFEWRLRTATYVPEPFFHPPTDG